MAIITLTYSPKESSLKERPEGSHWFECSLYLMLFPKGEFLRTSPRGPIVWRRFFLSYCKKKKSPPPPTTTVVSKSAKKKKVGKTVGRTIFQKNKKRNKKKLKKNIWLKKKSRQKKCRLRHYCTHHAPIRHPLFFFEQAHFCH